MVYTISHYFHQIGGQSFEVGGSLINQYGDSIEEGIQRMKMI
jgi:hypothetical protein